MLLTIRKVAIQTLGFLELYASGRVRKGHEDTDAKVRLENSPNNENRCVCPTMGKWVVRYIDLLLSPIVTGIFGQKKNSLRFRICHLIIV